MDIASLTGHEISNPEEVPSPALLIYPTRVLENIRRMLAIVGDDPSRLRPHVKTHKLGQIVKMQLETGITKYKCATIAEAEMTAAAGATDVLIAYQPVGPNVGRVIQLIDGFPGTTFSVIVDNEATARALSAAATDASTTIGAMLDVDCGMHRSGIEPGDEAEAVYRLLHELPGIEARGLHAYDGHIHDASLEARTKQSDSAFEEVRTFRDRLGEAGLPVPVVIAGGTPTFPVHAKRDWVECSPGTCVLSDANYGITFPDMDFLPATFLFTRIVSKPGPSLICLDLGHKAVAAENPIEKRVRFPELLNSTPTGQSEEHLVLECPDASELKVGQEFYGVPWHICPTVALHAEAAIVDESGRVTERWPILARARRISI